MNKSDLTNETFGKLKVLGLAGQDSHKNQLWKCQCICGGFSIMTAYALSQRKYPECRECTEKRARQAKQKMKSHTTKLNILDLYLRGQIGKTRRCEPS